MKDRIESCHLTMFNALRVNKDQVMDLETCFRLYRDVYTFETRLHRSYKPLNCFNDFCDFSLKWASIRHGT